MPPRALKPSGLILVDKPAGPSSFQVMAEVRRRTRARTGHAGTLDPFATGLLLVLSGAATRLAPWLVGLDKRYVTDVDLSSRTSTGDPEGEMVEETDVPDRGELEERLDGLRGEVDLPIPAASAVKIDGERAYKLHRRGEVVEMPVRRSTVSVLELLGYDGGVARLDLRVGSGTYIRSIADALGGHCLTLRRLEVGPFSVDDADDERILPAADALPFLPVGRGRRGRGGGDPLGAAAGRGRHPHRLRRRAGGGRQGRDAGVRVARSVSELERTPRAVALGTFDGVHRGHRQVIAEAVAGGGVSTVVTFDPHPRRIMGYQVEQLATLERRLELFAELGVEETLVIEFTLETQRIEAGEFAEQYLRAIGAEVVVAGEDFRFAHRRSGDLALLAELGFDVRPVPLLEGVSSSEIRRLLHDGEVTAAAGLLGRPPEVEGIVVEGDARGGTLGFPTANVAAEPGLLVPLHGIYAGFAAGHRAADLDRHEPALRRRRAAHRGVPARLRRRPVRQAPDRRAVAAPPRRDGLRQRAGTDRPDRPRRRGDRAVPAAVRDRPRGVCPYRERASPLRRGSAAAPPRPTRLTPPK